MFGILFFSQNNYLRPIIHEWKLWSFNLFLIVTSRVSIKAAGDHYITKSDLIGSNSFLWNDVWKRVDMLFLCWVVPCFGRMFAKVTFINGISGFAIIIFTLASLPEKENLFIFIIWETNHSQHHREPLPLRPAYELDLKLKLGDIHIR